MAHMGPENRVNPARTVEEKAAQKASLITLGKLAVNHWRKQRGLLLQVDNWQKQCRLLRHEPAPFSGASEAKQFILMRMSNDARKLTAIGQVLGEDGEDFESCGGVIVHNLWRRCGMTFDLNKADELVDLFHKSQGSSDEFKVKVIYPPDWIPSTTDNFSTVDWEWWAWTQEFFSGYDASRAERCSHCGVARASSQVFQAGASCRNAIYCDETCQRFAWHSGHKNECQEVAGDSEVKNTKAKGSKPEDSIAGVGQDKNGSGEEEADSQLAAPTNTEESEAKEERLNLTIRSKEKPSWTPESPGVATSLHLSIRHR